MKRDSSVINIKGLDMLNIIGSSLETLILIHNKGWFHSGNETDLLNYFKNNSCLKDEELNKWTLILKAFVAGGCGSFLNFPNGLIINASTISEDKLEYYSYNEEDGMFCQYCGDDLMIGDHIYQDQENCNIHQICWNWSSRFYNLEDKKEAQSKLKSLIWE